MKTTKLKRPRPGGQEDEETFVDIEVLVLLASSTIVGLFLFLCFLVWLFV